MPVDKSANLSLGLPNRLAFYPKSKQCLRLFSAVCGPKNNDRNNSMKSKSTPRKSPRLPRTIDHFTDFTIRDFIVESCDSCCCCDRVATFDLHLAAFNNQIAMKIPCLLLQNPHDPTEFQVDMPMPVRRPLSEWNRLLLSGPLKGYLPPLVVSARAAASANRR